MKCVLFSRPNHDGTLEYLHYYSKELIDLAKAENLNIINKEGSDVTKEIILSVIEKKKPNLIMFNGHGSPKFIFGHKDKVLISSDENPQVLKNTITYALSCSSALILGKRAYESGAIAFIGYQYDFALGKDPESEASPRRDKIAKFFLEPSNILFSSLIKGINVKDSIEKAKKKMEENIGFLSTTDSFPEAPHLAPYLYGNYIGLIAHGDEEAFI